MAEHGERLQPKYALVESGKRLVQTLEIALSLLGFARDVGGQRRFFRDVAETLRDVRCVPIAERRERDVDGERRSPRPRPP